MPSLIGLRCDLQSHAAFDARSSPLSSGLVGLACDGVLLIFLLVVSPASVADCVSEFRAAVDMLHQSNDVALGAAAAAIEDILSGMHAETIMAAAAWAWSDQLGAGTLQLNAASRDLMFDRHGAGTRDMIGGDHACHRVNSFHAAITSGVITATVASCLIK